MQPSNKDPEVGSLSQYRLIYTHMYKHWKYKWTVNSASTV